jgi:hypothetical protein
LKIHTITSPCHYASQIYCNDRLYIQSVDDVIYHDIRYPDVLFYIDLISGSPAVKLLFDQATGYAKIPKANAIKVSMSGKYSFKVNMIQETGV